MASHRTGCTTGTLTTAGYRRLLQAAGFAGISVTPTSDPGPGLHSAIVKATPPGPPPARSSGF